MIFYLCSRGRSSTISSYLENWAPNLLDRVQVIDYSRLPELDALDEGAFIFADVERLDAGTTRSAHGFREALDSRRKVTKVLNHPTLSLRRYDLLKSLRGRGSNAFDVFRPTDALDAIRYPVFVRHENEHRGSFTPLLNDRSSLESALASLGAGTEGGPPLLIVEYLNVGRERLYRKYSATCVAGEIIAHHIFFGTRWMVKGPSLAAPEMIEEEREYQERNPHQAELTEIFRDARIDYGRIDYALFDGRIQVWEINTNPMLLYRARAYTQQQIPGRQRFSRRFNAALEALDPEVPPS
jgi:hypothetical protein